MTGNTLSPQMRRFRKLDARRQTARRTLPQSVLPPAHPSAPRAGDNSSRQSEESREEGVGREIERGEAMGPCRRPRSSHCRRFISFPSSSHPLIPAVVVPHRIVRRFRLLVAPCSCFPQLRSPSSSRPAPRLVHCPVVVSFLVSSSFRSSSRPPFVGSFSLPVSSTREAGRFLVRWRAGKQAEGGQTGQRTRRTSRARTQRRATEGRTRRAS